MYILGIESSCDETSLAIVEYHKDFGIKVRANNIISQIAIHAPFGGVVPEIASRAHLSALEPLMEETLVGAKLHLEDLSGIAVTQGPGLIGSLLVGASYAKGLALALQKPLIPVDHVEAHVHGALLGEALWENLKTEEDRHSKGGRHLSYFETLNEIFPALALVVSGGHTNLYYMKSPTHFEIMGYSIDDACGECFDKVGKLLELSYPAGPIIEKRARTGHPSAWKMPEMLPLRSIDAQHQASKEKLASGEKPPLYFSYSGLKTYLAQTIQKITKSQDSKSPLPDQIIDDLCASFQEEALGQIVRKTKEALLRRPQTRSCLIAGGVAANKRLRTLFAQSLPVRTLFPDPKDCSDNGAMIAAYALHQWRAKAALSDDKWFENVPHAYNDHSWECYSRYRFERVMAPLNIDDKP